MLTDSAGSNEARSEAPGERGCGTLAAGYAPVALTGQTTS